MLRYCILLICALSVGVLADEDELFATPYVMEDEIEEMVKNMSDALRKHDPYLVREAKFGVDNEYVVGEFEAADILIRGFSGFEATEIRNKITVIPPGVKSKFKIKLHEFHFIVPYYYLDLMAVFVPFYGSGSINLKIREVHAGVDATFATSLTGKLSVKKLKFAFNMTDTSLYITGIVHNEPLSQIVSTSTTECFAEFVNTHNDRLGGLLGDALIDPINRFLSRTQGSESVEDDVVADEVHDDGSQSPEQQLQKALKSVLTESDKTLKVGPYTVKYSYKV